jgi:hypothetical protein
LIGIYDLIDDRVVQVVHMVDQSVVVNTFNSNINCVLDLVVSESAYLADEMDYDFWHAALGHPFKANVNGKLYYNGYLILDW